jgi:flavin-binding protein dodecin
MRAERQRAAVDTSLTDAMSEHTYRIVEIVGTSPEGVDAAIRNGVSRASQTLRQLDWFEVQTVRGELKDGQVAHFQVTLKVGFRLE